MRREDEAGASQAERRRRHRRGIASELVAIALLVAKGYRILARRERTRLGEIDIIAVRGRRLAFVEVKRRPTLADAEAAITPALQERIVRAGEEWARRRPAFRDHELAFDVVLVAPRRWPRHLVDAMERAWRPGWR